MERIEGRKSYQECSRYSKSPTPELDDSDQSTEQNSSEESIPSNILKTTSCTSETFQPPVSQKRFFGVSQPTELSFAEKSNCLNVLKYNPESFQPLFSEKRFCNGSCILFGIALVIVLSMVVPYYFKTNPEIRKNCTFEELKQENQHQDQYLWLSLRTGIENIINKQRDAPGVYLFVHNNSESSNKLISDIARAACKCFDQKQPVEMEIVDFTSEEAIKDYGYSIEKYEAKIKEGNVILIANLNDIPAESAGALHTICDTYNPIVKNVIIFLTLKTDSGGKPVEAATNTLNSLWGPKLERTQLDALITRVTDEVIALQS